MVYLPEARIDPKKGRGQTFFLGVFVQFDGQGRWFSWASAADLPRRGNAELALGAQNTWKVSLEGVLSKPSKPKYLCTCSVYSGVKKEGITGRGRGLRVSQKYDII